MRPTTVRVLGFTIDVVNEDSPHFSYMGEIDHHKQLIRIREGLATDEERETLLHEILHGISKGVSADLTEAQVTAISRGLYAVLRDNAELATYLTST